MCGLCRKLGLSKVGSEGGKQGGSEAHRPWVPVQAWLIDWGE